MISSNLQMISYCFFLCQGLLRDLFAYHSKRFSPSMPFIIKRGICNGIFRQYFTSDMQHSSGERKKPSLDEQFRIRSDLKLVLNSLKFLNTLSEVRTELSDCNNDARQHYEGKHHTSINEVERRMHVHDYPPGVQERRRFPSS